VGGDSNSIIDPSAYRLGQITKLSPALPLTGGNERRSFVPAGDQAVFMTKNGINFDTMLAHVRLAKVYSAAGQSDRSAEQVAKALERASRDQRLESITNETMLMETVAQVDKAAPK